MKHLLIFLLLIASLCYANDESIIKSADKMAQSTDQGKLFRAYNSYKNVYLRALMSDNYDLKKSALKGIVKSGKKLHIEISKYEIKLKKLKKPAYKKIRPKVKTNTNKVLITHSNRLKSVNWSGSNLVLTFKDKLTKKDINYFKLLDKKKKSYRYVFDIHGSLNQSKIIKHNEIDKIQVSQYNSNTLRLVIKNSSKLKINYYMKNNKLIVKLNVKKVKAPDTIAPRVISKDFVVVIDPGHGGKDGGATGYKRYLEKNVVYAVSVELKKLLVKAGYKVHMTRSKNKFIKLRYRTKYANRKKADLFISIHANAVGGSASKKAKVYGMETYFLSRSKSKRSGKVASIENSGDMEDMKYYQKQNFLHFLNREKTLASNKLAIDIQRNLLGQLRQHYSKIKDGGVREGPFWVLVGAQMPAVLVEIGFISNPMEAKRLVNKTYQKRVAKGIFKGIDSYFQKNP
ncbi:MAG: N-acetylmuramoyl-L-alanine amidase [Helicobacteraceae bacterium]|nr:N-acetylmuramoyl-L-alanine amidase [Helicobacteraceae bacterium]